MRAAVIRAYGPPNGVELADVPTPVATAGQLVVRVHTTTVNMGDTEIRASNLPWLFRIPIRLWLGVLRPKPSTILGMEVAGVVADVGGETRGFAVGDEVVGAMPMGFGAHADFARVDAAGLVARKPEQLTFDEVAPLPVAGLAALGYLRKGGIEGAKTVMVRGASGAIGTYAVQLAKHFGAEVTAVCGPQALERMRELGADVVIDYTQSEFDADDTTYDLILDVVGQQPIGRFVRCLTARGAYVRGTVPGLWEVCVALWYWGASRKRVVMGDAGESVEDLRLLVDLLVAGTLETVIDRRYPLEQIADAHAYVETGHKQGHVLIQMSAPHPTPRGLVD
jgi:NADPH:quinone reductase-like Zn-dependent oxidoreductase